MQKTERLLAITLLLQARGKMTAQRLAELLEVSPRTIYRDIDALSLAHVPVSMDYGPGGGFYLPDDYHLDPAMFTREEAVSLILGVALAGNYSLFADDDDLHRALLKLEAALPEEYRGDIGSARQRILFDTAAWYGRPASTAFLETIRSALLSARQLDILYPDAATGVSQWLRIDPCGLVYKGLSRRQVRTGIWYLVAFCHRCQSFTAFRVIHIEDVRVCEDQVITHPDFDLRAYWEGVRDQLEAHVPPLPVTLRVKSDALPFLRGEYAILREGAGGDVIIRLNVESVKAAISYALALGTSAVVLSPAKVREAVAAEARNIVALYE